jgi:thioesterase domain-containing protein
LSGTSVCEKSSGEQSLREHLIAPIQPATGGIPLFLVAPGGEAMAFRRTLGASRPLYGIRVPNLEAHPEIQTVESLAAICARAIRQARPQGPYALAGWCAAGFLALEIARQLEYDGQPVAFVAILDARTVYLPPMSAPRRLFVQACHQFQRCRFFLSQVLVKGVERARSAAISRLNHARDHRTRARLRLPSSHSDRFLALMAGYRPLPWTGRLIHFWAAQRPRGVFRDPQFIYSHLSPGGFTFYEIPGDHVSMLAEPSAFRVGAILAIELDLAVRAS